MSAPTAAPERFQRGALGVRDIVFFVVAAAAPLTVMAGIAPIAIMVGGIGAPSGYLIAGIVLSIFAVGFTAMSKYIKNAGAFYSYIAKGLGKPAGVGAAALIVWQIDLLTGAGDTVNWILIALVQLVFLIGVGYALRLRGTRPATYALLATTNVDAEELTPTTSNGR